MDFELERWCDAACSHIRFKPDRELVKQELQWHIEDKMEALADSEKTLGQKRGAVLEAMGDPHEVGKALAKEHKPWLGWLWLASRRILIFTAIIALLCSFGSSSRLTWGGDRGYYDNEFTLTSSRLGERLLLIRPNAVVTKTDGYRIRLIRAAKWKADFVDENGTIHNYETLYFTLDTTNWLPWMAEPTGIRFLTAVDSEGNTYTNSIERGERAIVGNLQWRGVFSCRFEMRTEGLDPDAKWIELQYNRSGRSFSFRILLTEGVAQ